MNRLGKGARSAAALLSSGYHAGYRFTEGTAGGVVKAALGSTRCPTTACSGPGPRLRWERRSFGRRCAVLSADAERWTDRELRRKKRWVGSGPTLVAVGREARAVLAS
jgi:hypothetical protein